jgi:hypothetical protein
MASDEWVMGEGGIWYYLNTNGDWNRNAQWTEGATYANAVNIGDDFYAAINVPAAGVRVVVEPDTTLSTFNNVEIQNLRGKYDDNALDQIWHFDLQTDGSYVITNAATGKCLEVEGSYVKYGANVQTGDYSGALGQKWFIFKSGNAYGMVAESNVWNMCGIDIKDAIFTEGNNVVIFTHSSNIAQQFTFETVDINDYNHLIGDVNGDGEVNDHDATKLQEYLVYRTELDEDTTFLSDADKNGKLNINDVTRIQYYCVGLITTI